MRAVLDTNVLLSGLFWRGAPYECLLAAEAGLYELVLAKEILEELRDKLVTKFQNTPEEAADAVEGIRRGTTVVTLTHRPKWVVADPNDDKFIETAMVGNAQIVVSGDHHLLDLEPVPGVEILSPRRFLQRLAAEAKE